MRMQKSKMWSWEGVANQFGKKKNTADEKVKGPRGQDVLKNTRPAAEAAQSHHRNWAGAGDFELEVNSTTKEGT